MIFSQNTPSNAADGDLNGAILYFFVMELR